MLARCRALGYFGGTPLISCQRGVFGARALDAVAKAPTTAQWLVVAAVPVTSVDVTVADALSDLDNSLRDAGVKLCFAELKDLVKLKRFGLFDQIGEEFFFGTIGAAVDAYQSSQ
jgi:MFS superfamily sulfate permease-like transporter